MIVDIEVWNHSEPGLTGLAVEVSWRSQVFHPQLFILEIPKEQLALEADIYGWGLKFNWGSWASGFKVELIKFLPNSISYTFFPTLKRKHKLKCMPHGTEVKWAIV